MRKNRAWDRKTAGNWETCDGKKWRICVTWVDSYRFNSPFICCILIWKLSLVIFFIHGGYFQIENMCPDFKGKWERQKSLLVCDIFQLPTSQNKQQTKVTYFGLLCSDLRHVLPRKNEATVKACWCAFFQAKSSAHFGEAHNLGRSGPIKVAVTILKGHLALTWTKTHICRLSALHDHLQGQVEEKTL